MTFAFCSLSLCCVHHIQNCVRRDGDGCIPAGSVCGPAVVELISFPSEPSRSWSHSCTGRNSLKRGSKKRIAVPREGISFAQSWNVVVLLNVQISKACKLNQNVILSDFQNLCTHFLHRSNTSPGDCKYVF